VTERVSSKDEVRAVVASARREGKTVGFVPTMGALHEGHLSLVRAASSRCDVVVASIFVNPTQFSAGEDFELYPRCEDADAKLLAADGVDLVWTPSVETMYAADAQVAVDPGPLAARWEGQVRPGHFAGAATIVAKLLNVVRPDLAFFGEKDYQQLVLVRRLVLDLDLGVGIVGCPIVRDPDGLALSSRNAYLTPEQRAAGLALPAALWAVASEVMLGERGGRSLEAAMRKRVSEVAGADIVLDYAAIVDPVTLEQVVSVGTTARAIIAGRVGRTRLIDNIEIKTPPGG